jgi:hypothetical protein
MQRTKRGQYEASPLISVFDRPFGMPWDTKMRLRATLLLVLVAATAAACTGTTTVTAKVVSVDGRAVPEAEVAVTNAPRPVCCTTDATGSCELTFVHPGWYNRYEVRVSKAGLKEGHGAAWTGRRLLCRATVASSADSLTVACE